MPFLTLQTNQQPSHKAEEEFLDAATRAASEILGKPESVFISAAHTGVKMRLAASSEPVAVLDLAGLGLTDEHAGELTAVFCELAAKHLEIRPERIHVRFENYERSMWGCNGKTFG